MTTITIRLLNPDTDTRELRTFAVPTAGGYVIEILPPDPTRMTSDRPQVCERLEYFGNTLYIGDRGDDVAAKTLRLRRLIGREQRRRLRAYRRRGE